MDLASVGQEKNKNACTHRDFMIAHHIIKFLVNFFVLFLRVGCKDIRAVWVRAVAPSVLLLVQCLDSKVNKKDQHIQGRAEG